MTSIILNQKFETSEILFIAGGQVTEQMGKSSQGDDYRPDGHTDRTETWGDGQPDRRTTTSAA